MKFPESALAHEFLAELWGIEIGGAAHNPFGLNTWNVDRSGDFDPHHLDYAEEQRKQFGASMPVDVVAHGDQLPFQDKSLDFVISSHVIEQIYDPLGALAEWARVARHYLLIICPQRDALHSDRARPLTPLAEHQARHADFVAANRSSDTHHSRWTSESFTQMCTACWYRVVAVEGPDTKVGNGFTIVLELDPVPAAHASAPSRPLLARLRHTLRRPTSNTARR